MSRVYNEMGTLLVCEYQGDIDVWTQEGGREPKLRLGRGESLALSASVLRQLSLAAIALLMGLRLYDSCRRWMGSLWSEVAITLFKLGAADPSVRPADSSGILFARTRGLWIAHIRILLDLARST